MSKKIKKNKCKADFVSTNNCPCIRCVREREYNAKLIEDIKNSPDPLDELEKNDASKL